MRSKAWSRSVANDGMSLLAGFARSAMGALLLILASTAVDGAIVAQQTGTTVAETYREAYDYGYRDGTESGVADRKEGKPYDLANKKNFQQAERGMDPKRHDREVFLVAYRRGFEDGYEKGYGLEPKAGSEVHSPEAESPRPPPARGLPASSPPPLANAPALKRDPTSVMPVTGTVPLGTELRVELLDELSTKSNERGDPFRARVPNDVEVDGRVIIPRGTTVSGSISFVKRAGRIRGRAQMNLKFEELHFPDGRMSPLEARLVSLETRDGQKVDEDEGTVVGESSRGGDAKTVAGSSGIGALIGVVAGGKGGAGAGAAAGAVAGLANVLITRGRDARLEVGTQLTIKLTQPVKLSASRP